MKKDLEHLLELAEAAAARIDEWITTGDPIFVTSHLDADGLSAASIICSALLRRDARFQLRIVRQLDRPYLSTLVSEGPRWHIFTDLGSGQLPNILEVLDDTRVVILDHHPPVGDDDNQNLNHVNPHLCGFDGTYEISGAGVTYLVARHLGPANEDLAALAVVGAIGDVQDRGDKHALVGLNSEIIVEDAKAADVLDESTDIRLFGRETRPIHVALQYTTDPFIPGITGNPDAALSFLADIGIELKEGDHWRTIADLTKEEKRKLNTALITHMLRMNIPAKEAQSIIGVVYTLKREAPGSLVRDVREFATLLNACGRSDQGGVGVAVCMGDRGPLYRKAENILKEYRLQLAEGINWLIEEPNRVEKRRLLQTFHGQDRIPETIVGSIASMALNSRIINWSKPVVAFAYTRDGRVKVSARTTQPLVKAGVHLGKIMRQACEELGSGAEGGGHNIAAGATIPRGSEEHFLEIVERLLAKQLGQMREAASALEEEGETGTANPNA